MRWISELLSRAVVAAQGEGMAAMQDLSVPELAAPAMCVMDLLAVAAMASVVPVVPVATVEGRGASDPAAAVIAGIVLATVVLVEGAMVAADSDNSDVTLAVEEEASPRVAM